MPLLGQVKNIYTLNLAKLSKTTLLETETHRNVWFSTSEEKAESDVIMGPTGIITSTRSSHYHMTYDLKSKGNVTAFGKLLHYVPIDYSRGFQ